MQANGKRLSPVTDSGAPHLLAVRALNLHGAAVDREVLGDSRPMREVKKMIVNVAACHSTVLITGESGTGKEVVARAIHNISQRVRHPFVAVNCGAIPEALIESELFGSVKGGFTGAVTKKGLFAAAQHGTIFLDEVGEMLPVMQV